MASTVARAEFSVVPRGSLWRFYYNGPVATNWMNPAFDDRTWLTGPGQLGYGEGDEQTVVIDDPGYEPTVYFRHSFIVTNRNSISTLTLRMLVDDGAVVYLNGLEIIRRNMPGGPVDFNTKAVLNIETNENQFLQWGVFPWLLTANTNVLAVEVHQHAAGGSDCSFELELIANIPATTPQVSITSPADATITNGPQLRLETSSSDGDGHITRVEFYTNGVYLGATMTEPFSFIWTNPPPGRYGLRARAFDNLGSYENSELIRVQIGNLSTPVGLLRGPYIQSGSSTSMVVRWRTDWLSDSFIRFGTNTDLLDQGITNFERTAEHEIRLTSLQPETTYFYAIGSTALVLASGSEFNFHTAPTNTRPVRIWVIGDSGTHDDNAKAVRDAYYQMSAGMRTDLWLMLGDNAYGDDGSDDEYQRAVFDMYPELLRQSVLWPTIGNHDAQDSTAGSVVAYLSDFTLPTNGEAGGVASGDERYYSYDYANIHFVCLDSFTSDRFTNGPMLTWLKNDLSATEKDWIIAYWHHPPYSWGSHNSDGDPWEIDMRQNVLPILEAYGVDLVLSGHSHDYERSFLIDGHYGFSWEMQPAMILDSGFGGPQTPYHKPAGGFGARKGAVYTVCGCSGAGGDDTPARHPAMAVTHGGFGSMIIEVNDLRLEAQFLRPSLEIDDEFAIDKSAPLSMGPRLQITANTNGAVLSWPTTKPKLTLEWVDRVDGFEWNPVTEPVSTIGRLQLVPLTASQTNRYFRLHNRQ